MKAPDHSCLYWLRIGAAGFAALGGLSSLVGWVFGISSLLQLPPGASPMFPIGALFMVFTAGALAAEGALAWLLAGLVMLGGLLVAGANLVGSFTPLPFYIPTPIIAFNMTLGGLALLLRHARSPRGVWAAQLCALLVGLNALRALLGFLSDDDSASFAFTAGGLTPPAALSTIVISLGLLTARPDGGFMALLLSKQVGGRLLRLLSVIGISIPLLAVLLGETAWRSEWFGAGTTLSLVLLANLIVFYQIAAAYDRADQGRRTAEAQLAQANTELERRVAERTVALQNREAQISAIGDNLPGTIIYQLLRDEHGQSQFAYVSAGIERVTGYRADAVIANSQLLHEQVAPEDRARLAQAEQEAERSFSVLDIEVRKQTPWGLRWSHVRSRPRWLANGLIAWDGIEVDITAQKAVEVAIERDRRYQAALFACAQVLLQNAAETAAERDTVLFDVLSHLLEGTNADRVFFIRTVEDRDHKQWLETPMGISAPGISGTITPTEALRVPLERIPLWFLEYLRTDEPLIISRAKLGVAEARIAQLFDQLNIQSVLLLPIWTSNQTVSGIGFQACTVDHMWDDQTVLLLRTAANLISNTLRRWHDKDELRRREELLAALFDILPVGVAIIDAELRPLRMNQAVSQISGFALPSIMGDDYHAIRYLHPDGLLVTPSDEVFPAVQALRGTVVRDMELGILRPDGKLRWTSISATPLAIPVHGAAMVVVDITERKRIEEERLVFERELLETQRLESLGILAGGVAHDFNNILTTIMGHADLARMELAPDHTAQSNLSAIVLGARRAADLTVQMLAYAGRGRFLSEALDLNTVVEEMGLLMRATLPTGVSFQYRLTPNLPLIVADGTQMRQVLLNLLTNAAEATAATGGTVTITTGQHDLTLIELAVATFSAAQPGRCTYLEVRDTGCGMDAATIARIFDPFFSTKFTGRGLGLAAVQGIVRAHRGALFVQSIPGDGAMFRVYFPLAPGAQ